MPADTNRRLKPVVMAGLVPAIDVFCLAARKEEVGHGPVMTIYVVRALSLFRVRNF
jgi:hypothetical protein